MLLEDLGNSSILQAAQHMQMVGPSSKSFTFQKRYLKALIASNDALSRLRSQTCACSLIHLKLARRLAVWDWLDFRPLDPNQMLKESETEGWLPWLPSGLVSSHWFTDSQGFECKMISEAINTLEAAKDQMLELRRCRFGTDAQSEMCLEQFAICQAFLARVAAVMFLKESKENLVCQSSSSSLSALTPPCRWVGLYS
eukprot:767948-Hanusia_phi.AAC.6